MVAPTQHPATRAADLIYCVIAALAGILAIIQFGFAPIIVGAVIVALVPWALIALQRELPVWLFAALALLPIAVTVVGRGEGVALFLAVAAISWIASRFDSPVLIAASTLVAIGLDFLPWLKGHPGPGSFYFAFGNAVALLCGLLIRRASRLTEELRAANELLARASADQERRRIARDVHDLVAHSLTIVVLHIGGARRVLRHDPETAVHALADAERVARESLDGIRGIVGLLRDDSGDARSASLDLEELVAGYSRAGLDARFTQRGSLNDAPLLVRVALGRVLQEALANAARHVVAHGTVEVMVDADSEAASVHVVNPSADATRTSRGGYGLVGLREQIGELGGVLEAGASEGNWRVDCRIPYSMTAVA